MREGTEKPNVTEIGPWSYREVGKHATLNDMPQVYPLYFCTFFPLYFYTFLSNHYNCACVGEGEAEHSAGAGDHLLRQLHCLRVRPRHLLRPVRRQQNRHRHQPRHRHLRLGRGQGGWRWL